jgi:hypothetical protein
MPLSLGSSDGRGREKVMVLGSNLIHHIYNRKNAKIKLLLDLLIYFLRDAYWEYCQWDPSQNERNYKITK